MYKEQTYIKQRDEKIQKLRDTLEETQEIVSQNVESLLERGASVDALLKKAQSLQTTSFSFRKGATQLKESFEPIKLQPKDPGCCSCLEPFINSFSSFYADVSKSMEKCLEESEEKTPLTSADKRIDELFNVF